jgi:hypothetical protein
LILAVQGPLSGVEQTSKILEIRDFDFRYRPDADNYEHDYGSTLKLHLAEYIAPIGSDEKPSKITRILVNIATPLSK